MAFESDNIPKETMDYLAAKKAERSSLMGPLFALGFLACIGAAIFVGCDSKKAAEVPRSSSVQNGPQIDRPYQADVLIADAIKYMVLKDYKAALSEISDLNPADFKRPGVQNMFNRATQGLHVADLKERRLARVEYAKSYELALLGEGMDAIVRATGQNADTLNTTFVLINRPFVFKIQNNGPLNATWASLGFKSVHLGDGYESSWSYKLR